MALSYSKINNETYEDYLQFFILTCQLSLSYVPKLKCSCIAENKLLEICKIKILSVNIRADASDMLLSYGSSENKEEAKIILDSLSLTIIQLKQYTITKKTFIQAQSIKQL